MHKCYNICKTRRILVIVYMYTTFFAIANNIFSHHNLFDNFVFVAHIGLKEVYVGHFKWIHKGLGDSFSQVYCTNSCPSYMHVPTCNFIIDLSHYQLLCRAKLLNGVMLPFKNSIYWQYVGLIAGKIVFAPLLLVFSIYIYTPANYNVTIKLAVTSN